jgi:membrane protease YdiL (CAAX protease family)
MRPVAVDVHLDGFARVLGIALAAYLIVGLALIGRWSHRRFRATLATDRRARLRRYRRTAALEWGSVAAAAAVILAAPGIDLADAGLRWPGLHGGAAPYTIVGTGGLALSVLLLMGLRRKIDAGTELTGAGDVLALLPRTVAERRAFAALSVTAGGCEEALYRGVLLALAAALRPEPGTVRLIVLSALAFGLAHSYQGGVGVLVTGVLGACLAVLYLGSGSLLLPVLYHALIDLRTLVLTPSRPAHRYPDRPRGGPRHRNR